MIELEADLGLDVAQMELGDVETDPVAVEGQRLGLVELEVVVFGTLEVVRQVEVSQRDACPGHGAVHPGVETDASREVVTPARETVLADAQGDDHGGTLLGVVVEAQREAVGLRPHKLKPQVEMVILSGARFGDRGEPVLDAAEVAGALENVDGAIQVGGGDGLAEFQPALPEQPAEFLVVHVPHGDGLQL